MAEIAILSIIQGITEFLPVSSSAHLILVAEYFKFNNASLTIDASLHLGSLLAIILYFNKDFNNYSKNKKILKKIIVTSIPVSICGYLLISSNLINVLRSYEIIGWSTIIFGILLYISDFSKTNKTINKNFNFKSVTIVSLFQILSLIPGVSRSGIIITSSRFLNFSRIESAKIAFVTSIPILTIVGIFNIYKILQEDSSEISILNIVAIFFSFIISHTTIKFFLQFLRNYSLKIFVIYRILLGIIILIYVYK